MGAVHLDLIRRPELKKCTEKKAAVSCRAVMGAVQALNQQHKVCMTQNDVANASGAGTNTCPHEGCVQPARLQLHILLQLPGLFSQIATTVPGTPVHIC